MLTDTMPRYALYRERRVRITDYDDNYFQIVLTNDTVTWVHRRQLRMLK